MYKALNMQPFHWEKKEKEKSALYVFSVVAPSFTKHICQVFC